MWTQTKHPKFGSFVLALILTLGSPSGVSLADPNSVDVQTAVTPTKTVRVEVSPTNNPIAGEDDEEKFVNPAAQLQLTLEKRINVEYKDVELSSVLRSLAWAHKINIVTSPDIKGKVNINLENVTIEQALDAILKVNGLAYSKKDGMIYVTSGDPDQVEMATDVINLKYIKAEQAQGLCKKLLSSKGEIRISEMSNSMIITDFPANIEKIKDLCDKVDSAPQQILIEAKIVDITSTDLAAMGIAVDADYQPLNGGLFDRNTREPEVATGSFNMPSDSATLDPGQFDLDALSFKNVSFGGTIDALVRDGKANLLASPSIAVLNGQEARIIIGERYPYVERTQSTGGTTETTKFVDIGTTLRVSPLINDDGYITLYIHPEVSSLTEQLSAGPRISTREADTTVRIKAGETLVIGGLIKQEDTFTREHVPFFGKIPLLGIFFSRNNSSNEQKELAVFITPKLLYSREEMKYKKKALDSEDHYLMLQETGRLAVVNQIFRKARALDLGRGLESRRKDKAYCKAQALSHYELISLEFPESIRAAESQYRAGNIYRDFYKDGKKAKKAYLNCASNFPQSQFAVLAKKAFHELEVSKL